jgi:hypothetical protein
MQHGRQGCQHLLLLYKRPPLLPSLPLQLTALADAVAARRLHCRYRCQALCCSQSCCCRRCCCRPITSAVLLYKRPPQLPDLPCHPAAVADAVAAVRTYAGPSHLLLLTACTPPPLPTLLLQNPGHVCCSHSCCCCCCSQAITSAAHRLHRHRRHHRHPLSQGCPGCPVQPCLLLPCLLHQCRALLGRG